MIEAHPAINEHKTAILFFSRAARAESIHKPLLGFNRRSANQKLAALLIEQTKSAAQQAGLTVIHCSEKEQKGENFGEKLANAFQRVYHLGFTSVIAIGNDTPGICDINWEAVTKQLNENKAVIGETQHGGAYLIGMNASQFDWQAFQSLSWQKEVLFSDLSLWLKTKTEVVELPQKLELNNQKDVFLFLKNAHVQLKNSLRSLQKMGAERLKAFYKRKKTVTSKIHEETNEVSYSEAFTVFSCFYRILKEIVFGEKVQILVSKASNITQSSHLYYSRRGPPSVLISA